MYLPNKDEKTIYIGGTKQLDRKARRSGEISARQQKKHVKLMRRLEKDCA